MTAGSALAAVALVGIATAPNLWTFTAAWILAGIAQAAVLYKPAFAAITTWYGPKRVQALTILTLAGGLASTVYAPLTAYLAGHFDWRGTYLVLAAILAALTIPAHAIALNPPWPQTRPEANGEGATPALGRKQIVTSPTFIALATAIALAAFAMSTSNLYLVPLMTGRGMDTATAAWTLGICGAGQLLGRIAYAPIAIRTGPTVRAVAILAIGAATTLTTALVAGPLGLVFATVPRRRTWCLHPARRHRHHRPLGPARLRHPPRHPLRPRHHRHRPQPLAGAHLTAWTGGTPQMFTLLAAITALAAAIILTERITKRL